MFPFAVSITVHTPDLQREAAQIIDLLRIAVWAGVAWVILWGLISFIRAARGK